MKNFVCAFKHPTQKYFNIVDVHSAQRLTMIFFAGKR